MTRLRVYVAGPLGSADHPTEREENVRRAVNAGLELLQAGFAPFIPHLTHYVDPHDFMGAEVWLDVMRPWVEASDAFLRLPGPSPDADQEEQWARAANVPIYLSTASLVKWSSWLHRGNLQRS